MIVIYVTSWYSMMSQVCCSCAKRNRGVRPDINIAKRPPETTRIQQVLVSRLLSRCSYLRVLLTSVENHRIPFCALICSITVHHFLGPLTPSHPSWHR